MEQKDITQLDIFSLDIEKKKLNKESEESERLNDDVDELFTENKFLREFQLKDFIEIIRNENSIETSDEFYVAEFIGKKGTIVEIEEKSNPIAFWVDFGKRRGIFYAGDMRLIG